MNRVRFVARIQRMLSRYTVFSVDPNSVRSYRSKSMLATKLFVDGVWFVAAAAAAAAEQTMCLLECTLVVHWSAIGERYAHTHDYVYTHSAVVKYRFTLVYYMYIIRFHGSVRGIPSNHGFACHYTDHNKSLDTIQVLVPCINIHASSFAN